MSRLVSLFVFLAAMAGLVGWFQLATPDFIQRQRYPLRYQAIVTGHARNYHLEPALLAAVIYAESKFDANATSTSGAIRLMQLLPSTADGHRAAHGRQELPQSDLLDPEINVRYGSWYLRHLLDKYDDERRARRLQRRPVQRRSLAGRAASGIRFSETRAYVDQVEDLKGIYRDIWGSELG